MNPELNPRAGSRRITRCSKNERHSENDAVTVEEPLEIRVNGQSVAVVMRTPGDDLDLVRGFLFTEGLVKEVADIFEMSQCPSQEGSTGPGNVVDVILTDPGSVDIGALSRKMFTSSSCGICGRATLASVFQQFPPVRGRFRTSAEVVFSLPKRLRAEQETFSQTGGLHASALFDGEGQLLLVREDVGRHNALDKVIGSEWGTGRLPLADRILLVSGRVSFELMQKALAAGIPLVAGISAPSSLAIDGAEGGNQCLVGFLRGETMNIYAHEERILV